MQAARTVAAEAGVSLEVRQGERPPWHPGRCAELRLGGEVVGYAGELHPRVLASWGLPARTCAAELDLSALPVTEVPPVTGPEISAYPPAYLDVALVVARSVPVSPSCCHVCPSSTDV
ncbi:MAG: hypothetical protein GEV09_26805 [Pseudonocardiaceae bacterium]|nr:hypothetical protein [Pseudonocardiaceae bacterium]